MESEQYGREDCSFVCVNNVNNSQLKRSQLWQTMQEKQ
jgi:hypothetical protein